MSEEAKTVDLQAGAAKSAYGIYIDLTRIPTFLAQARADGAQVTDVKVVYNDVQCTFTLAEFLQRLGIQE